MCAKNILFNKNNNLLKKISPVNHKYDRWGTHQDDLKTPESNVRNRGEHIEANIGTSDLNIFSNQKAQSSIPSDFIFFYSPYYEKNFFARYVE